MSEGGLGHRFVAHPPMRVFMWPVVARLDMACQLWLRWFGFLGRARRTWEPGSIVVQTVINFR